MRYLSKGREAAAPEGATNGTGYTGREDEDYWMSEGVGDSVNLLGFLAVPHGTPLDPAKQVCTPGQMSRFI